MFKALGPIIQLVNRCLEREPESRLYSADLERRLGGYISTFASVEHLHCTPEQARAPRRQTSPQDQSEIRSNTERSLSCTLKEKVPSMNGANPSSQRDQWSQLRSRGLTTTTIPSPGPESSLSSLSSFNFENDVQSDTVVAEDESVMTESSRATDQYSRDVPFKPRDVGQRLHAKNGATGWKSWHNNDRNVDPRLAMQPDPLAFIHANDSASESSDTGNEQMHRGDSFLLPPTRPSSMHPASMQPPAPPPTKALPAAPNSSRQRRQVRDSPEELPPRTSGLEPRASFPVKTPDEDDFQALSLENSSTPQKRRQVLGKGNSFFKNL